MSLYQQACVHQLEEQRSAVRAVMALQRGDAFTAAWRMEEAAMERHLAYEKLDTWSIVDALWDSRMADGDTGPGACP